MLMECGPSAIKSIISWFEPSESAYVQRPKKGNRIAKRVPPVKGRRQTRRMSPARLRPTLASESKTSGPGETSIDLLWDCFGFGTACFCSYNRWVLGAQLRLHRAHRATRGGERAAHHRARRPGVQPRPLVPLPILLYVGGDTVAELTLSPRRINAKLSLSETALEERTRALGDTIAITTQQTHVAEEGRLREAALVQAREETRLSDRLAGEHAAFVRALEGRSPVVSRRKIDGNRNNGHNMKTSTSSLGYVVLHDLLVHSNWYLVKAKRNPKDLNCHWM
ncbi:hypothetical protein B0H19DRAFT_1316557 [Mycena capillaripes]|nr:hypothetical protein B0H19DRAFT_1316557 [Mycena capillaripes]